MNKKRVATIVIEDIKQPDGWNELLVELGLLVVDDDGNDISSPEHKKLVEKHFQWGEYASVELEIDEDLKVVGGRIIETDDDEDIE